MHAPPARAACTRESPREAPNRIGVGSIAPTTMAPSNGWTNRWSVQSAMSAATIATEHSRDTEYETPVERSMNEVHWADSHDWIHNPPEWIKEVKNYRKQGMPIIHLMESKQTLIAIGVSNHGKPGLYFTRKLPF
jgi:hypothetical protein